MVFERAYRLGFWVGLGRWVLVLFLSFVTVQIMMRHSETLKEKTASSEPIKDHIQDKPSLSVAEYWFAMIRGLKGFKRCHIKKTHLSLHDLSLSGGCSDLRQILLIQKALHQQGLPDFSLEKVQQSDAGDGFDFNLHAEKVAL